MIPMAVSGFGNSSSARASGQGAASSGFAAPDLFSHLTPTTDTDKSAGGLFTDGSSGPPSWSVQLGDGVNGNTRCFRSDIPTTPGGDAGGRDNWLAFAGQDRVVVDFAFKFVLADPSLGITSILKFARGYDTNDVPCGPLEVDDLLKIVFDQENLSAGKRLSNLGVANASTFGNGWNRIAFDLYRANTPVTADNPTGSPSVSWMYNGSLFTHADGNLGGSPPTNAYWTNNVYYGGERGSNLKLHRFAFAATLNQGNTNAGYLLIDDVSISTRGWVL